MASEQQYSKEVVERRQWALNLSAALTRGGTVPQILSVAEQFLKWTTVRSDGK